MIVYRNFGAHESMIPDFCLFLSEAHLGKLPYCFVGKSLYPMTDPWDERYILPDMKTIKISHSCRVVYKRYILPIGCLYGIPIPPFTFEPEKSNDKICLGSGARASNPSHILPSWAPQVRK